MTIAGCLKADGSAVEWQGYAALLMAIGRVRRERGGQFLFNLSADRPICRRQYKAGGGEGRWTGDCYMQDRNGNSTRTYSDENGVFTLVPF